MKPDELEKIISEAFENKQNISENSDKKILDAIKETIELTDKGLKAFLDDWAKTGQSILPK